jgi:hypothetical protein
MFEVFSVRSVFVYSTKIFEKTVGVETFALKFINNQVGFWASSILRIPNVTYFVNAIGFMSFLQDDFDRGFVKHCC